MAVLFWLLVGHAAADWQFQSAAHSRDKNPLLSPSLWFYAMSAHCLVNAGAVAWATGSIVLGVFEFGTHFLIDVLKCYTLIDRNVDQALHFLCKLCWAFVASAPAFPR